MTRLNKISVTATAESALKKLKKGQIPVYDCKKRGADFIFCVKDKHIKKVFAIFAKPCYNIRVEQKSVQKRLLSFAKRRACLIFGAFAFLFVCLACGSIILKIEVSGSGSYLEPAVKEILFSEGAGEWKSFSSLNKPAATGRILSLPNVTFCNIYKSGSVLCVNVIADGESSSSAFRQPLKSDVAGKVKRIVALCGTAAVNEGDEVKAGDALILPECFAGEKRVECLAAGYAEIECRRSLSYLAEDGSEESVKEALATLLMENDEPISIAKTLKPAADNGVYIIMDVTFLHKIKINV